ncbi:MAG: hypothetical protein Q9171_004617 [Xanthocarpia ochracea]
MLRVTIRKTVAMGAAEQGVRVLGGYCPSVGIAGGYVQSGGHGPLAASYGMAADNTLEFEVVTVDGKHLVASLTQKSDLYWALSGGGGGNYVVVLPLTTKAYPDGPTAGASLAFINTDLERYLLAIGAFNRRLLSFNSIPGFATSWGFDNQDFFLNVATLPGGSQATMRTALDPFVQELTDMKITLALYNTTIHDTFYDHFMHYDFPPEIYATNATIGGRIIPTSTVRDNLPDLLDIYRTILWTPLTPANASAQSL